jgi:murein endopeptidase
MLTQEREMHRKLVKSPANTPDIDRIVITRLLKNRSFKRSKTTKERKWLRRLLKEENLQVLIQKAGKNQNTK